MMKAEIKRIRDQTREIKNRMNLMGRNRDQIDLSRVMGEIQRVRRSGERPKETIGETDMFVFECELCINKIKEGELTQCAYCGRWICRDQCYSPFEGACISCSSVIRLKRESVEHIKEILRLSGEDDRDDDEGELKENEQEGREG